MTTLFRLPVLVLCYMLLFGNMLFASLAAPVINSTSLATGNVGSFFAYQITAANSPTSYTASGLPAGLSLNTSTGLISGTPVAVGTSTVSVGAANAVGAATATVSLQIAAALPTVIRLQPLEVKVTEGFPAIFSVVATGGGTLRYQWRKNGVAVSGGTLATFRIDGAQKSDEVTNASVGYDVVVTGEGGSVTSARVGLAVVVGGAYVIENPAGGSVRLGTSYILRVMTADPDVTYQWRKDGVSITGGTGASHTLSSFQAKDVGRYDVVLRNWAGEVVSASAYVGLATKVAPNPQRATYDWVTLAGNGFSGNLNGTGRAAQFDTPSSIAMDGLGNLYVADTGNHVIRRVTQTGVVTTVAGLAGTPGTTNGSALSVGRLNLPAGVAVDKSGAVYIAEPDSNTIRKLTNPGQATASLTTIAGVAGQFGTAGGINGPSKVAVDASGGVYFMDVTSIRRIDAANQFTLLFGELPENHNGTQPLPLGMTIDAAGKLYAAANETGEFKIFSRLSGGTFASTNYGPYPFSISDLALGVGNHLFAATESTVQLLGDVSQSVPASGLPVNLISAVDAFAAARGLTVDAEGTVFAVDPFLHVVLKGSPSGLPVFLLHPVGATGADNVPLTLSSVAIGAGTVSYQWYRDGVAIAGATGASYTMASGGSGGGVYSVEASNAAGTVTSGTATVVGTSTPLAILSQPRAASVVVGTAVALEVGWQGPGTTTFQWYKNNVLLSGGTSAILRFSSAKLTDTGDYRVELRAASALQTSDTVRLTVEPQLTILSEPKAATVPVGTSAALEVGWEGPSSTTFQWYRNGVALSGGTSAILRLPSAQVTDTGDYRVELRAGATLRTSATVRWTVEPTLAISSQPRATTVVVGTAVALEVGWQGPATTTFQWFRNNVALVGGTSAILRFSSAKLTDTGDYRVELRAASALQTSEPVRLTVEPQLTILSEPRAATVQAGTSAALEVGWEGPSSTTFQWYRNNVLLSGGTSAVLRFPSAKLTDTGNYWVELRAGATVKTSSTVGLTVDPPLAILRGPQTATLVAGTSAALVVDWEGPRSTTIQWYRNNVALSGGTLAVYQLSPVRATDAGLYRVELKAGSVLQAGTATITVNTPVSIFNQPEKEVAVASGKPFSLTVSATGTAPLTYQWYKNEAPINSGTASTYRVQAASSLDAGTYKVEVRNVVGPIFSESSTVSILTPPKIESEPAARSTVNIGGTLTFSVGAIGSQPLVYQWRKDGVPTSGGTAAALELRNVQEKDAGIYDVLVSNALGSVTSGAAQLVVNLPPKIVTQPPASIPATVGAVVTLGVVAAGTDLSYQWYRNNDPIIGANLSTYSAPTLELGSAQYVVEVKSRFYTAAVRSGVTTVTVVAGRGISVLRNPEKPTNVIRGTAASVRVSVDSNPPDALRTTYKLVTSLGAETGISGTVPANGQIDVPLRSLTADGLYKVVLSREYMDGQVISGVVTADFEVRLRTLENAAGTYEVLLSDVSGLVGDNAAYRGLLIATVSKTGAVSGRVLYNEAAPLQYAIGTERAYVAVVRSFSSSFTPSAEDPSRLVCTPKLGVGTQANRQALALELDFSAATVELSAFVRDRVSVSQDVDEAGSESQGTGAVRGLTKLNGVLLESGTVDFSPLEGRYAIGSDFTIEMGSGPGLDNNATLLAQVLKTGKVLWTSRLSGSTGSGSATLSTTVDDSVFAQIYQGRTSSTSKILSTTSLLGQLRFQLVSGGTVWSAGVVTNYGDDRLERQSCYVSKAGGTPELDAGFDIDLIGERDFRWSGAQAIYFQNRTSCRWPGSTAPALKTFFNSLTGNSEADIPLLYLTAEDPVLGDTYVWTVALSPTGTVRVANYTSTLQPTLTFRFDRTRGEWTGSFLSPGTRLRCNLVGVVARPSDEEPNPLGGAGWVETGALPATRTGEWRLQLNPPEAR